MYGVHPVKFLTRVQQFAMLLLDESKLEILRQYGNGDQDLPSWVPDWSVPWWAEPGYTKPKKPVGADGTGERSSIRCPIHSPPRTSKNDVLRERRIKRLEMAVKGSAVLKKPRGYS